MYIIFLLLYTLPKKCAHQQKFIFHLSPFNHFALPMSPFPSGNQLKKTHALPMFIAALF